MGERKDKFLCQWMECGRTFSKASKLEEHMRSHTNNRPFACDQCEKRFLRRGHLQRHQQTAHCPDKHFTCAEEGCGKAFGLRHHLKRHERLHAEPKPFKCIEIGCEESFARREQLRRHEENLHFKACEGTKKSYLCGVEGCGQIFEKWSLAVAHRKTLHTSRQFACEHCTKVFMKKPSLDAHVKRMHQGVTLNLNLATKRFACDFEECKEQQKVFASKYGLKVHVATVHKKRKPWQCGVCEAAFGHKHLLVRHRRLHEKSLEANEIDAHEQEADPVDELTGGGNREERPFECTIKECRRRFLREYDLDRHTEACHSHD